jgi:enoyl-CoA hydratase
MTDVVLYERRGPTAWITLNRPEKLNALNDAVVRGLEDAVARATADDEVRVVVLAGAGRAFSAGYDLSAEADETSLDTASKWRELLRKDVEMTMRIWSLPKPTIAAVRGWCLAGGMEVAMACDLLICTEDARFGEPEIRYGSGPVTLLMPFILGERRTRELLLTGDTIDAPTALQWGLVNRVVAADELDAEVDRFAARIAPTPLEVLRLTKLALNRATRAMGLLEAVEANLDLSAVLNAANTPEQQEFDRTVREQGLKAALAWRDRRYGEILSALGRKEEE